MRDNLALFASAIDGDELGTVRPGLAHPCGEGCREQRRIDPVHQDVELSPAGNTITKSWGTVITIPQRVSLAWLINFFAECTVMPEGYTENEGFYINTASATLVIVSQLALLPGPIVRRIAPFLAIGAI